MLPYSLPHPQLSLTPNGHLSLNAVRVRTEPFLPMISPVTTTARTQLLSMDPSPTTDSNMPTQDMKPKFKPLLSGHPSLDATLDKLSPPMSSPVMTTTLTQNLMMDPLSRPPSKSLTHGHPSPDATQDKFLQTLLHVMITTRDQIQNFLNATMDMVKLNHRPEGLA